MPNPGVYDGESLRMRCWICGDSKNQQKGHLKLNLNTGLYHCFRCGSSGRMPSGQLLTLQMSYLGVEVPPNTIVQPEDLDQFFRPGPAYERRTLLPREHLHYNESAWDVFIMRDSRTEDPIGYHLRRQKVEPKAMSVGEVGLSWSYDGPLISTPDNPLVLVEGPYDVQHPNDVCVYGMIRQGLLDHDLRGHYLVFCPDGDVWKKKDLFNRFVTLLQYAVKNTSPAVLLGVKYIVNGLDPDEIIDEQKETKFISRDLVISSLLAKRVKYNRLKKIGDLDLGDW
jgi:hypothetical protein